jgi:hypothetical protein
MSTALVKPSKTIKANTSMVSMHLNAVERAREIYLAQIKRAEADYFERINKAMGTVANTDETEQSAPTPNGAGEAPPAAT